MANPHDRVYPDREALALYRKAKELGYPMDNPDFFQYLTLWQLDEMVTHGRYDA
jgi:hypothetical protein